METGNTKVNMHKLKWKPREEPRAGIKVTNLFKARQNLIEIPMNQLETCSTNNRNSQLAYKLPSSNVNCHLYSFYPSTVRLWNRLPEDTKLCKSVNNIKQKLDTITLKCKYY